MWGNWFSFLLVGVIVLGGLIALSFAASPLFAVLIAVVVGGAFLVVAALRRTRDSGAKTSGRPRRRAATEPSGAVGASEGREGKPLPASPEGPSRGE